MSVAEQTTHMVICASAGAGKTYALSNRYLKLMHQGASPDTILATTFTRKAAAEILGRVLTRLARAALDEHGAAQLAKDLGVPALTLPRCRQLLFSLCRSLHRVSISTIDSFFNRMVQGFRHELGIPPGARIVGPDDPLAVQLRHEAIAALLADEPPAVLIDLLRRLHHDRAQRSITDAIDRIVARLYDVYRQAPPEAWQQLESPAGLSKTDLVDALNSLTRITETNTHKALAQGLGPNLQSALAHDWERFLGMGITPKIDEDPPLYRRAEIPPRVIEVYAPLVAHARAELVGRVARQNQATFELLERFDRHYARLRHAHRVLLFSDLPHKLARELPARGEELLTDLYYRLDARVGHLLLDEFQDTSVEQWGVLLPFAQEIRSFSDGSRSFFCVGDTKQAIYGWRGGCAELFDSLENEFQLPAAGRRSMSKSYRSSPAILDAVNRVFTALPRIEAVPAETLPVVTEWSGRFSEHSTHHAGRGGYVELITSPLDDSPSAAGETGEDEEEAHGGEPTLHEHYAAGRIAELARELPAGHSLGVLVSTNEMVRRMVFLLQNQGVEASGEGGGAVTDDPAVGVVISALVLADHPGDTAAAFHVLNSPLAEVVGLDALTPEAVGRGGLAIRAAIMTGGYAGLISGWARRLAASCTPRSVARLMQLVELADRFDPAMTLRTRDFVAFVEATPVEQPAPAAVRVMTVYKAKGLEFDTVVLPQLDRTLLSVGDLPVYTHRESPTGPIAAIYRAANEAVRNQCPPLAAAYEEERARRLRDDLCALYVAMTRPRFALHMIIRPLKQIKNGGHGAAGWSSLSFATILRRALGGGEPTFEGEEVLFSAGDPQWHKKIAPAPAVTVPAVRAGPLRPTLAPATTPRRSWAVVAPSAPEAAGTVWAADLLGVENSPERRRGTVLHGWFEQIGFVGSDELPGDAQLLAAAAEPGVDDARLRQWLKEFRSMLAQPAVAAALATPRGSAVELWRERAFGVRVGERLVQGRFDRVVIERDGDAIKRAELLDFKTDTVNAGGLPARVEAYRPQAQLYREALAAMLGVAPGAVRARLLFVTSGDCVEV